MPLHVADPRRRGPGYTLFDLADRLSIKGWQLPAYTLTGTAADIAVQGILVRLGVSRDMASLPLDDFRKAIAKETGMVTRDQPGDGWTGRGLYPAEAAPAACDRSVGLHRQLDTPPAGGADGCWADPR